MASIYDEAGVTPVMVNDFLTSDLPTKIKALRSHIESFKNGLEVKTADCANIATVHAAVIAAIEPGSEDEKKYLAMKAEADALVEGVNELVAQQIAAAQG